MSHIILNLINLYFKPRTIVIILGAGLLSCRKNTIDAVQETGQFVIENLGVTFGAWDKETNQSGDFLFTADFPKIFGEFGSQTTDYLGNPKILPTMDFIIKNDAFVFAIAEGIVEHIEYQEEVNDYEFSIRSLNDQSFVVIYDHFINLQIETGDTIQPGDPLGNARPYTPQIGGMELMVNNNKTRLSYCPFCFFNEEKIEEYQTKILQLMHDWEEFKGDTSIYDESSHVLPGCRFESLDNS